MAACNADVDEIFTHEWPERPEHHQKLFWERLGNPKAFVGVFRVLTGIFVYASFVIISFVLLVVGMSAIMDVWLYLAVPIAIFGLLTLVEKSKLLSNKGNFWLNRQTGMVVIPRWRGAVELPFEEFDAYLLSHTGYTAGVEHKLQLVHRYSNELLICPQPCHDSWEVEALWEYWQQYMDVSRPLPDVPIFEPVRELDPVTAAYDREHNRPKYYWRNISQRRADHMVRAARLAAASYPWGLDQASARRQGWEPSGFGEGDWQRRPVRNGDSQVERVVAREWWRSWIGPTIFAAPILLYGVYVRLMG
ncbi:hypothetical protein CAI21_08545 [Alkalilimnicola ehrlichii]|uniref:Uncharacterized protein n=2 Tax=Alkalilimnicola ehrlichii TaxID=351052 RepID=A0A3E0WTZ1_9GAMM|nr:hypothetical protein CAI21_08545 [Alkalilimnicola ehrlichii]RFA36462.1 hypothetical protein CAL65_10815 [Alkalilimnicola ehrlichii]